MKAFDPQWIAFRNFVKTRIQFCRLHKNNSLVFVTFEQYLNWMPNDTRWLKPEREKQSVCWSVAYCLEWWAREHGKFDSRLFESLWVTLIAIGFALVFKVQLSGAKFNVLRRTKTCCEQHGAHPFGGKASGYAWMFCWMCRSVIWNGFLLVA